MSDSRNPVEVIKFLDDLIRNRHEAMMEEEATHALQVEIRQESHEVTMRDLEAEYRSLQALKRTMEGANLLALDAGHLYFLLSSVIGYRPVAGTHDDDGDN